MEHRIKTALITGATSGIGLELARLFTRDHYRLVITSRKQEELEEVAGELAQISGQEVIALASDLSQINAARTLYAAIKQRGLELDVLVNNAGYAEYGFFTEVPLDKHLSLVQLNAIAPVTLMKLFLDDIVRRAEGRVLNVVSGAAFQPGAMLSVYHATKAFMLFMTEAVQDELKDTNITLTALCPGPTRTAYHEKAHMFTRLMKVTYMDAAAVAKAGYDGMQAGETIVVPGLLNKLLTQIIRLGPRPWVVKITRWLQTPVK